MSVGKRPCLLHEKRHQVLTHHGIREFSRRDPLAGNDEYVCRSWQLVFMETEEFPNPAFEIVSLYRVTDLLADRDS